MILARLVDWLLPPFMQQRLSERCAKCGEMMGDHDWPEDPQFMLWKCRKRTP